MTAAVQPGFAYHIEYPESDGEPMGETDVHIDEMIEARAALKNHYRDADDVYVAGNLLVYYEEGNVASRFAPDVLVVFGVPKHKRRVYKIWEERKVPSFVLEVTSRGTRLADKGNKMELCAELGVKDYFLFDPEADYLKPPLQGYRLVRGRYRPIAADERGRVASKALGLLLAIEGGKLRLVDPATGEKLLRLDEHVLRAEREAARAEEQAGRAEHEAARATAAEARAAAAEAEVERLKGVLEKAKG